MKGADRQPPRPTRTASCSRTRPCSPAASGLLLTLLVFSQLPLPPSAQAADANLLFEQANQLKDANQCAQALELYKEFLSSPKIDESLQEAAMYNQATCFELVGQPAAAAELFTAIAGSTEDTLLQRDSLFRIASLELQQGNSSAAGQLLRRLLRTSSSNDDRVRIHILLASVSINAQRRYRAARHLRRATRLLNSLSVALDSWYTAQHQLLLGDLFVLEASRITLPAKRPQKVVKQLARRGALLERAQSHFVAAISSQIPRWMQASTLHLGIALIATSKEMKTLEGLLDAGQIRGSPANLHHLQSWLSTRRPSMARKAFESLQLCLDVVTESGVQTGFSSSCKENLDEFPMDLLVGPNPPP